MNFTAFARIKRSVATGVVVTGFVLACTAPGASAAETVNGLTLPSADPVLALVAPHADQPDYAARVNVFLQATVPNVWNDQPVGFLSVYTSVDGQAVLGLPTSRPGADPSNPAFVYQRFQDGVLFFNGADGTTQILETDG
ncbi:MAG: hypothetical protein NVSMB2_13700 [Chloroflexota bacterium]